MLVCQTGPSPSIWRVSCCQLKSSHRKVCGVSSTRQSESSNLMRRTLKTFCRQRSAPVLSTSPVSSEYVTKRRAQSRTRCPPSVTSALLLVNGVLDFKNRSPNCSRTAEFSFSTLPTGESSKTKVSQRCVLEDYFPFVCCKQVSDRVV